MGTASQLMQTCKFGKSLILSEGNDWPNTLPGDQADLVD